uniref:Uncharacterized protein n=1 Tax=Noctiluca scintillans TaxID=2966 RepID=A0A7S1A189_NOCSC|mmetsp:Transcript_27617/g.72786  ORF Transcript_27617/g.72786 Transcript_27617/m.72786 type:complete len:119 (+) Transcript_27617:93-449(+)
MPRKRQRRIRGRQSMKSPIRSASAQIYITVTERRHVNRPVQLRPVFVDRPDCPAYQRMTNSSWCARLPAKSGRLESKQHEGVVQRSVQTKGATHSLREESDRVFDVPQKSQLNITERE